MRAFEFILLELTDKVKNLLQTKFEQEKPKYDPGHIRQYIDKWDRYSNAIPAQYKDITRLNFDQVEQLIDDAETRAQIKGKGEQKRFDPRDDLIYDQNNLTIFRGDMREKCIQYGDGYTWCISRKDASNMFNAYRYRANEPTFYFIFDKDRPRTDKHHAIVIYINNNGDYFLANAQNTGDEKYTWEQIIQIQPKIAQVKELMPNIPLSTDERESYEKYGKEVNDETYRNLSLKEKYKYIQFGTRLSDNQQSDTPNELISVYAKMNPFDITSETYNRLSSGDRRKVKYTVATANIPATYIVKFVTNAMGGERFPEVETKIAKDPQQAVIYATDVIKGPWPEAEPYIMRDPKKAITYAKNVLKKRWPEAEDAIKTDPFAATYYARDVIRKRWPAAEPYIMKVPVTAMTYMHEVIKGPWPEAEPYIIKDLRVAVEYARDVIGGRSPELETYIMKDPTSAVEYAKNIIKKRWPEAEPYIMKDHRIAIEYARDVIDGRWPKAEPYIMKDAGSALGYARSVLKKRWPEAEDTIKADPFSAAIYARDVIRKRWPEAEPYIMKDPDAASTYAIKVLKKPWPEAEDIIKTDSYAAITYALYVLKRRWPEAEDTMQDDEEELWYDYKEKFGIE